MGASVYPYAIIGLRVPSAMVFGTARVKAFEHNFPQDWEVDPKTGRKLWTDGALIKAPFREHNEEAFFYNYFVKRFGYAEDARRDAYICLAIVCGRDGCETGGGAQATLPPHADIAEFMTLCKDNGIWNASAFGLWADSHCSY